MIRLNLLPASVRAAELLRRILLVAGVVYACALAWVGWQWAGARAEVARANREVDRVQEQLNAPELQEAVTAVQKFADDMAAVKAKASVVNELRKEQVPVVKILDEVPDWTMDGQVWLSHLAVKGGKNSRRVEMNGATLTKSTFVQYYDFLGAQPGVTGLSLDQAPTQTTLRGHEVQTFRVSFDVGVGP